MQRKSFRRAAGLPAVLAAMILAGATSAAFGQIVLPTGDHHTDCGSRLCVSAFDRGLAGLS